MENFTIKAGIQFRTFGGWYRHDYITINGKELHGYIQVRRRKGRVESITCFPHTSSCVIGQDVRWLIQQNEKYAQELR
jgi:hypothetical protein